MENLSLKMQSRAIVTVEVSAQQPSTIANKKTTSSIFQKWKREGPAKAAIQILFPLFLISLGIFLGGLGSSQSTRQCFSLPQFVLSDVNRSNLSLSLKSEPWFWGDFPLHHNISDEELFWRASFDPERANKAVTYIKKVAFMFLAIGPLPLAPIWEDYFEGHAGYYSIYVHTAPGYTLSVPSSSVFHGRQIPSQAVTWGDISMVDAERRLLGNALLDVSNERFVLLSETCVPVYKFGLLYDYVIHSTHSFVGVIDDPSRRGRGRYNRGMRPEIRLDQWRKGPQWFEVSRYLALQIIADDKYYPKFRDVCKPACYPDEHYIPTFLSMQFGSQLANRSLTAVDWSRNGPHPAMYGKDDVTADFLNGFRNNKNCVYNNDPGHICFFFARKFSPSTLEPLQRLSQEVLNLTSV